jgi:hypothetical protein
VAHKALQAEFLGQTVEILHLALLLLMAAVVVLDMALLLE